MSVTLELRMPSSDLPRICMKEWSLLWLSDSSCVHCKKKKDSLRRHACTFQSWLYFALSVLHYRIDKMLGCLTTARVPFTRVCSILDPWCALLVRKLFLILIFSSWSAVSLKVLMEVTTHLQSPGTKYCQRYFLHSPWRKAQKKKAGIIFFLPFSRRNALSS